MVMQKKDWFGLVVSLTLLLVSAEVFAQDGRLEEARRYLVRGSAAMEIAKTQDDLAGAATEFRKATQLAPVMSEAWFNLGAVEAKLGHYKEAITAYQNYLQLSPNAENAPTVNREIIKLEYLHERSQAKAVLSGTWIASGPVAETFQVTFEDEKFVMRPASRSWLGREVSLYDEDRERDRENSFKAGGAQLQFVGRLLGDRVVGERMRPETVISFDEEQPLCKLPEHRGPFEGRLENDGQTLMISFSEPRYNVYWIYLGSFLALGSAKTCSAVEEGSSESMVLHLARQQPVGASTGTATGVKERSRSASDYLVRGALALESAKSSEDLLVVEAEFKKATEIDPQLADAWYNLGLLYSKSKNYPQAVAAYQKYLAVSPSAPNAKQIEDEITKLQYFQERQPELPKPGWTFLAKKTSGDRQGDTTYIDLSTVKNKSGINSVKILWDYATPVGRGWDYNSLVEWHEVNCGLKQGRIISREAYQEHMGKGELLHQFSTSEFYKAESPGTMAWLLVDAVCR